MLCIYLLRGCSIFRCRKCGVARESGRGGREREGEGEIFGGWGGGRWVGLGLCAGICVCVCVCIWGEVGGLLVIDPARWSRGGLLACLFMK